MADTDPSQNDPRPSTDIRIAEGAVAPHGGTSPLQERTSLGAILWLFFQIGVLSFGGGLSAWLYREIVEKRKWLTATDFLGGMALVQALPGVNMTNMSVYVGQRLRGVPGVLTALFGLLSGPFFILIGLGTAFHWVEEVPWSHAALAGVATAAVGLLLSMGVKAIRNLKPGVAHGIILVAIVVAVGGLRLPMIPVVAVLAPISVAVAWFEQRKARASMGDSDAR